MLCDILNIARKNFIYLSGTPAIQQLCHKFDHYKVQNVFCWHCHKFNDVFIIIVKGGVVQ